MVSHLKDQWDLERTMNVVGMDAITRQMLWAVVAAHVVAKVRLQHGFDENLLSETHIL